jgi:hypothetical protein
MGHPDSFRAPSHYCPITSLQHGSAPHGLASGQAEERTAVTPGVSSCTARTSPGDQDQRNWRAEAMRNDDGCRFALRQLAVSFNHTKLDTLLRSLMVRAS